MFTKPSFKPIVNLTANPYKGGVIDCKLTNFEINQTQTLINVKIKQYDYFVR